MWPRALMGLARILFIPVVATMARVMPPHYASPDKTYLYGECFLGFFCVKLASKSLNFSC